MKNVYNKSGGWHMSAFRKKMFRGAKIEDVIERIEQLTFLSKERAERYAQDDHWKDRVSAEFHEGVYQGYKDTLEILKAEFDYGSKSKETNEISS